MRIANPVCAFVLVLMAASAVAQTLERGKVRGRFTILIMQLWRGRKSQSPVAPTGFERTARTDDSGVYRFLQVPAGEYQLAAESAGFAPTSVNHADCT